MNVTGCTDKIVAMRIGCTPNLPTNITPTTIV